MLKAWLITKRLQGQSLQRGFSPVEVLLAASLFGIFSVALVGALIYGRTSTAKAGDRGRAAALAEEGIEATKNIKDASFANLTDGPHGLAKSGGIWVFSGTSDVTGGFTRVVTVSTIDTKRKAVVVTVSWTQGTVSRTVTVNSRFTAWTDVVNSWANAVVVGGFDAVGNSNGWKVTTAGNYAYLVRNTGSDVNFLIVDISTPTAPTLAGSLTMAGVPTGIAVSGNFAYIANSGNSTELQIVNITNPALPVLTGTYDAPGNGDATAVAKNGNFAYLTRLGEMRVVNVTVPAAPVSTATFGSDNFNDIDISGTTAYLASANDTNELRIVNIATPASPTQIGTFNTSGATDAIALTYYGNTVYIATGTIITSLNVTTPASVTQLGTYTLLGTGNALDVQVDTTGTVFVGSANNTAEIRILDASTPASMVLVRTIDVAGTSSNVNGMSYNAGLDVFVAASDSNTQELITIKKN